MDNWQCVFSRMQVLPGLNGVLPEAALNLVIYHLQRAVKTSNGQLAMCVLTHAGDAWPEWGAA
jgi:hypothetical protein